MVSVLISFFSVYFSFSSFCLFLSLSRSPLLCLTDLWMRRAYNGYMYCQGSTTGHNLEKIHPGDIVRIEWNGPDGTLSFSVNGGELEVGFNDITDDIYPACGSYRNGVVVKLLKVEIFGGSLDDEENDENEKKKAKEDYIPSSSIAWILSESLMNIRDTSILQHQVPKEKSKAKKFIPKWITARGNKGALYGVHDWEFQFNEGMESGPWAVGFTANKAICETVKLGLDTTASSNTSLYPTYAWWSDGSLWFNGKKAATSYGSNAFPLRKHSTIKLRINRRDRTASFYVNGECMGVAFGPVSASDDCGAYISLPSLELDGVTEEDSSTHSRKRRKNRKAERSTAVVLYPAASVFHQAMSIRIKPAGMESSIVLPFLSSLSYSSVSVLGNVTSRMIQGVSVDKNENELNEWLRSAIFSGGIDSSYLYPEILSYSSSSSFSTRDSSLLELQKKISDLVYPIHSCPSSASETHSHCLHIRDSSKKDLSESDSFVLEIAQGVGLENPTSKVSLFYEWLEKLDSEPLTMRKALEKIGNYRFPSCELPFIASLLKHVGMIDEAFSVTEALMKSTQSINSPIDSCPSSSEEMFFLWSKVKQLRSNLRRKKQQFKVQNIGNSQHSPRFLTTSSVSTTNEKEMVSSTGDISPIPPSASSPMLPSTAVTRIDIEKGNEESENEGIVSEIEQQFGKSSFGFSDNVIWSHCSSSSPEESSSTAMIMKHEKDQLQLNVKSLGLDYENNSIYLYAELNCSLIGKKLPNLNDAVMTLYRYTSSSSSSFLGDESTNEKDKMELDDYEVIDFTMEGNKATTLLWFDCSPLTDQFPLEVIEKITFSIGTSGWEPAQLTFPLSDKGMDGEKQGIDDFDSYCSSLIAKAQFLLLMKSTWHQTSLLPASDLILTKSSLLDLSFGGNTGGGPLLRRESSTSSSTSSVGIKKTQERWKRVVEFLHVHSKIRRQLSNEGLGLGGVRGNGRIATKERSLPLVENGHNFDETPAELTWKLATQEENLQELEDDEEDHCSISTAQATITACSVFIHSDNSYCSASNLYKLMKKRFYRANNRIKAFTGLQSILQHKQFISNPLLFFQLLVIVKNSIPPISRENSVDRQNRKEEEKSSIEKQQKGHYLMNLEGCSAGVLKSVQDAFSSLYVTLSETLGRYLTNWEEANHRQLLLPSSSSLNQSLFPLYSPSESLTENPPPHLLFQTLLMILKMWSIQFSGRDYGWIINSSSLLPILFRISSFAYYEKILLSWNSIVQQILSFTSEEIVSSSKKAEEDVEEDSASASTKPYLKLYSKDYVNESIRNGRLNGRSLLFHLYHYALLEGFDEKERALYGLNKPFAETFSTFSCLKISTCSFSKLSLVNTERKEAMENARKREQEENAVKLALHNKQEIAKLKHCGIFDSSHCAKPIKLSECNTVATMKEDRSGLCVCVYLTISYDFSPRNLAAVVAAATSATSASPVSSILETKGNYFEITILSVGQGDVGIGYADPSHFKVNENMPGWVPHSYGYHGDDGKKYGAGLVPDEWPLFDEGDIIGCGLLLESGDVTAAPLDEEGPRFTIFYTRNGQLLGNGFTNVKETKLTPLIGFSNRHDETVKVKINFGVDPFAYDGDEVIVSPKSLEERAARLAKVAESSVKSSSSIIVSSCDKTDKGEEGRAAVSTGEEETTSQRKKESYQALVTKLKSIESQLHEYSLLRNSSLLMIRYLLFLSTNEGYSFSDSSFSEEDIESSSNMKATEENGSKKQEPATVTAPVRPALLQKEVSTFGTPKALNKPNENKLQANITSALLHELFIGSLYLTQNNNNSHGNGRSSAAAPSFAVLEEKLLNVDITPAFNNEHPSSSAITSTTDFAIVESSEVIHLLHSHLLTLNMVLTSNHYLREEVISHSNGLKTLLNLLLTPPAEDIHDLVIIILKKILPDIDPDLVEGAIPSEWRQKLAEYEVVLVEWKCVSSVSSSSSSLAAGNKQSNHYHGKKMPDSLIKILLLQASSMFTSSSSSLSSVVSSEEGESKLGYGYGDMTIRSSQLRFSLLQCLFEASNSSWSELVAYNISLAYRHAIHILASTSLPPMSSTTVSSDSEKMKRGRDLVLFYAAAASCTIMINNLPSVLVPGAKIEVVSSSSGGSSSRPSADCGASAGLNLIGTLIGGYDYGSVCDIIYDNNLPNLGSSPQDHLLSSVS
jgi:hypothetical protein